MIDFSKINTSKEDVLLINKIATVQYFEEILTNGKKSLRFPVKKVIYEDGRKA